MNNIVLTRSSRIFFIVFGLILLLSVASAGYKYMVIEDYDVFLAEELESSL